VQRQFVPLGDNMQCVIARSGHALSLTDVRSRTRAGTDAASNFFQYAV
jgi:hypothetical protein